MRTGILVISVLMTMTLTAQKADTLRLYYAINEKDSPRNYYRIDSTVAALHGIFVDLSIYGYADFLCGPKYNADLSQARAERVKNHFLERAGHTVNIVVCEGKGESCSVDNKMRSGEPSQRKVDIIIERAVVINVSDSKLQDAKTDTTGKGASATPTTNITKEESKPKAPPKKITELNVGESISIEGLNFEPGRHVLRKESIPVLRKLLATLQENPTLKIEIQGHVCCIGRGELDGTDFDTHEDKLSENRAKFIYLYLVQKGIKADRLSYKGFGGSQPKIFPEKTFDDQQANRRVEIKVLGK